METCQPVLVLPIAFGADSAPGPKDPKSPWQQPLNMSWSAELTKKLLACERQYGKGFSLTIVVANGQLCPLPEKLQYDELCLALQEVYVAREDFPLLIAVDILTRAAVQAQWRYQQSAPPYRQPPIA